jgi:hypothetical protein
VPSYWPAFSPLTPMLELRHAPQLRGHASFWAAVLVAGLARGFFLSGLKETAGVVVVPVHHSEHGQDHPGSFERDSPE